MTPYQRRRNPYVNRMIQDMQIRNFAASTIDAYTWHVNKFCQHFGKTPEELGLEEIRQYQIYLVNEKRSSWSAFNQAVCGLRFLYEVTLGKPWAVQHIPFGKRPKKLPVVLSDQEASRLIECTENPKHRTVLLCCYAAGLRLAEATHLKVADIDGQRAQIRITSGKGSKKLRARLAQTARRPAGLLAAPPPQQLSFPWADSGRATLVAHDSESVSPVGGAGRDQEHRHAAHAETFVCDEHARSGSRCVDDQQAAGALQFRHHDDLSACATPALRTLAQPHRLAAGAAVSAVGRASAGEQDQGQRSGRCFATADGCEHGAGRHTASGRGGSSAAARGNSAGAADPATDFGTAAASEAQSSPRVIDLIRQFAPRF